MGDSGFWLNLDLFIDRQNEALDNWLGGKAISLNSPQEPEEPKKRDSKPVLEVQESSDLGENPTIHSMKVLTSAILATRKKKPRKIHVKSNGSTPESRASGRGKRTAKRYYKLRKLRKKKKPSQEDEGLVVGPIVDCSFNLPRVSSQLERLMGTNVVRLTDRKYMQELRKRIKEDYNVVLHKRIAQREAKEVERTRNLLIEGYAGNNSNSTESPPLVLISKQTHSDMARRRAKLKTVRERNAERLVRQGIKWEKERLANLELERQRQIEAQKKREEELMIGHEERFAKIGQSTRIQIQTDKWGRRDDDDEFSETDRYDHGDLSSGVNSDTDDMGSREFDVDETNVPEINGTSHEREAITKDEALEHLQYEDPAITLLKATDNVDDLYALADEIISGSYGKNNSHRNGDHN
ncbi:uncharacterized protein LOC132262275 isoform X2 [Phlebotomus argentipes]|uniref:uncharacterized protein LOC132262275 isoform X2 n=1 Tax=Phlebotomus argentipes TaxID=94469 RepID=UPI002892B9B0|nr:uncharacterized protein LOC132262275 isoform X2 [Phlebotomus argentipes]